MIKILLAGRLNSGVSDRLKEIPEFEIEEMAAHRISLSSGIVRHVDAAVLDASISCDEKFIARAQEMKLIVQVGSALNHPDHDLIESRGIEIRVTPFGTPAAIAGYTIGLILAALNHIGPEYCVLHSPGKETHNLDAAQDFTGLTLGIAGLTRTGIETADLALSMGMKVIYSDTRAVLTDLAVHHLPVEQLIRKADILCFNLEMSSETSGLISGEWITQMKPGAIIIDYSAPGVVDLAAVVNAVRDGNLMAAAVDVEHLPPMAKKAAVIARGIYPLSCYGKIHGEERDRPGNDVVSILREFFNV